jgi:AraC-like DNA-binding protein
MKQLPLTEVGMLRPFVAFLEGLGAPVNRALDSNNLSREMVDRGRGKVTKLQFYQFLATAGPGEGLPDFGYRIGEHYGMGFMGPVGRSVLRAATLKDSIDTFALHLRAWLDGNQLWLEPNGKNVWLCNRAVDGLEEFQTISNQCAIMTLISLVREVAGDEWAPNKVRLDDSTALAREEIGALANAEVERIGQGVAIQLPAKFLSRPIHNSSNGTEARLPPAEPEDFGASLEKTLRDQLPFLGVPTIPQAAEIAGTSPRTLQRQLGTDGLTYRRLIDRIRFQVARERLREDPQLTARELADELAYGSPSSFVRSFKRIAGVTPGVYARQENGIIA